MFEKFTERGRQVVVLAQDEARKARNKEIGRPHLLAGLLREEEGLAARVLERLDPPIDLEAVRAAFPPPQDLEPAGQIPFTPRAKKALQNALRESLRLGHNHISTEHLLLGLARDGTDLLPGDRTFEEIELAVGRALTNQSSWFEERPVVSADLDQRLSRTIDRAAALVKDLVSEGRQASLTVYDGGHRVGAMGEVRVNVLYETFYSEDMESLALAGKAHGFGLEFSKAHGATLRPLMEAHGQAVVTFTDPARQSSTTTNRGEPGGNPT